ALARKGKFCLHNNLGSTTALTNSGGSVSQSYSAGPFGNLLNSPTDSNPFQFTGRENDGSGLLYYRARYYNPAWGRFVSQDPIGFAGGINPYVYADDNPIGNTDPTRLGWLPIHPLTHADPDFLDNGIPGAFPITLNGWRKVV